jgi:phage terminase large subunit GpA-like protein
VTSEAALCGQVADGWAPGELFALAQWIVEHVVLPSSVSATPGKYDLDAYPYWRGVIEQAENPETEKIVILASTQLGKTTLAIALMLALSRLFPAPGMFAAPDRDASRELREKIYAIAEASGFGDSGDLPPPRLRNDRWIDLAAARWHSGIAFNTQTLSGKSCARVFKTELSRWRKRKNFGDPKLIADERVKAFFRSLILEEGTPSDENCSISASYDASDRRRLHVPCPHCNHFQDLRPFPLRKGPYAGFGGVAGVKTDDGKWVLPDEALEKGFYLCERGCRIENDQKDAIVRDGVWVPKGQHVGRGGKLCGEPLRGPRVAGFRLNAMYAQTVSFGRMLSTFIERRGKQATLQTWWNDWAGHKFTKRVKTPNWRRLGVRLRGDHAQGTVPSWALFLTAGSDPGPGYIRWTVSAWGEGSTSARVAYGTTRNDGRRRLSHFAELLPEVLERDWPLVAPNALGEKTLRVAQLGIDVGYRPHQVHEWWRSLAAAMQRRVRQVAGVAELKDGLPWAIRKVEVSARTKKPYPGGQERWLISRAVYSAEVHDRWKTPRDEEGAWLLPNLEPGQMEVFLQEVTNEAPVRKANSKGRMITSWEKIKKSIGNHYGDCSAYELAIADMLLDRDWTDIAARLRRRRQQGGQVGPARKPLTTPDGRPFLVTER